MKVSVTRHKQQKKKKKKKNQTDCKSNEESVFLVSCKFPLTYLIGTKQDQVILHLSKQS